MPFSKIVSDFNGIISRNDIDLSLIAMFKLGYNSSWNELVAFNEINTEDVETCDGTELLITTAGHEYLDFVATHFEYFNIRVSKRRYCEAALFSPKSLQPYPQEKNTYVCGESIYYYQYMFEETINNVLSVVEQCCKKMANFFDTFMSNRYQKNQYLHSPFVYGDSRVLHGERILHTHIRYIDNFRLFLLNRHDVSIPPKVINEILVRFIEEYIHVGERYPAVLTERSTENLFPDFKKCIQKIKDSDYESTIPINLIQLT